MAKKQEQPRRSMFEAARTLTEGLPALSLLVLKLETMLDSLERAKKEEVKVAVIREMLGDELANAKRVIYGQEEQT
jgi:hypothetical protein